ncbi:hypothetical protein AUK40_06110 [Candidatus Wirthbacteria bacterium CG2_30_54_11]|uniref:Membrane insertase YidC/Oxa/ALB C-terminal domain-containing protein n=1 Tax=Candidatus Wirthbacteria bacterium CG2_30_54_11 TaxID=1817892 RepID=A0A1J5ISQ0_9BACT|nr:MAG: hypothetical protein AUK40_06110 [Candidatus Wirthbacteria bacterium CG2_30_54_11]
MAFIGTIWNTVLYIPLLNIMVGIYQVFPVRNLVYAIIIITFLSRLVLGPLMKKSLDYQKSMQKMQPEMEKLKQKYGKDKEKLYAETMKLYAEHKANPTAGCLPLLLQLPFTIALYQVLQQGLRPDRIDQVNSMLYSFVPAVEHFVTNFLWLDLTKPDKTFILPVLVAGTQYLQSRAMMSKMTGQARDTAKTTMIYMPLMFLFISLNLPSGLSFYILLTTLLGIVQQMGGYRAVFQTLTQRKTAEVPAVQVTKKK